MPLDSSIIGSGQKFRLNNPFEALAAGRQAQAEQQAQREQSALRGQQFQQNAQQLAAGQVEADELAAYKASIGNPDLTPESLLEEIRVKAPGKFEAARGRYEAHQQNILQTKQLKQQLQASTKAWIGGHLEDIANSDYSPLVAEATLKMIEAEEPQFTEQAAQIRQQLLEGGKPALKALVDKMRPPAQTKEGFTLGEGQTRFNAAGDPIAEGAPKAAAEPATIEAMLVQAIKAKDGPRVRELLNMKKDVAAAGRAPAAPKDEGLVQIAGPGGVAIWVKKSDAEGKPAAQAARGVTGIERQSLAFFNRADEAVKTLTDKPDGTGAKSLEDKMAQQGVAGQLQLKQGANMLQTQDQQRYRQAQRAFTEARLRKESGAAIPPHEYENDAKTYFAQPLDGPDVIAQKRKARETLLGGMAFAAGKAYDEFYGEPRPGSKATTTTGTAQPKADPLGIR